MNDMSSYNINKALVSLIAENINLTGDEIKEFVADNYYVDDVYSTDVLNQ